MSITDITQWIAFASENIIFFTQELAEEAVEAAETVSNFVVEKIKGDKSC